MSSLTYASHLASGEDSIQHKMHIYQFQELSTMIAREQIEEYLPKIEAMINNSVSSAMSRALSGAIGATQIDVNRIVDVTIKGMNAQFHSEELTTFIADNLKAELTKALQNIDLKLIIS